MVQEHRRRRVGGSVIKRVGRRVVAPFATLPMASDVRLGAAFRVLAKGRWPGAHVTDVARLFRLALEQHEPGARHHAVAEEGHLGSQDRQSGGAGLGLSVRLLSSDEVTSSMGRLRTSLFSTSVERMDGQEAGLGADRPRSHSGPAAHERGCGRCALMNGDAATSRLLRRPTIPRRAHLRRRFLLGKVTVLFEAAGFELVDRNFPLEGQLVSIDTEDLEKYFRRNFPLKTTP